jgi:hypothetical protein
MSSVPRCALAQRRPYRYPQITTSLPLADDRREAIKKELVKLLAIDFSREVFHPEWLANPVLVRKKNTNEWRMRVDYINLNKHYPKDPFRLSWID